MQLPNLLYQYKPYLLAGAGVWCSFAFNNPPGYFAGFVLVTAGALIYWARH